MAAKAPKPAASEVAGIKPAGISLACLSPDLSTLVVCGANGLISCYSLKDSCSFLRVLEDPHHLTRNISCLAWGDAYAASSEGSAATSNQPLIAAGAYHGNVVLYDFSTGSFKQSLGSKMKGHTKKVTDIVFSRSKQFLFTSSMDGTIIQWNLLNGQIAHTFQEQTPVSRILLSSNDSQLIVADSSIRIYDIVSRKVLHKIPGHSSKITALATTENGKYLFSATRDEIISLWSLSPSHRKANASIANFMSHSGARYLHAHYDQETNSVTLYGLSHFGVVFVWNHKLGSSDLTPSYAKVIVKVENSDSVKSIGIFAFKPIHPSKICLIYGDFTLPRYALKNIMDGEKYISRIQLHVKDISLVANKEKVKEFGQVKDTGKVLSSQKHMVVGNEDIDTMTMEPRAMETQKESMSFGQQIVLQDTNLTSEAEAFIQVDSTACNIIAAAVQSKNKMLLEKSIAQVPDSSIEGTVKALPVYCIPPLIAALSNMQQMNHTMTYKFNIWVKSILTNHSSYLIASPNLVQILSNIYQLIDERLSSYHEMKQLYHKISAVVEPNKTTPVYTKIRGRTKALLKFNEDSWLFKREQHLVEEAEANHDVEEQATDEDEEIEEVEDTSGEDIIELETEEDAMKEA